MRKAARNSCSHKRMLHDLPTASIYYNKRKQNEKNYQRTEKNHCINYLLFYSYGWDNCGGLAVFIKQLSDPQTQVVFKEWVEHLGLWGMLLMLGIQMLQIFIAFIPGEPVEIIAGILYGGIGGLLICLFGCVLASACVFLISRRLGRKFVNRLFGENQLEHFAFLHNIKRLETVIFLLFLIPGTPKDMLTYVVGISPIKMSTFLILSTVARIPSIVTSTYLGENMRKGDWAAAIALLVITGLIGLLGIWYKDRLMKWIRHVGSRREEEGKKKKS